MTHAFGQPRPVIRSRPFTEVFEDVRARAALQNPDVVFPLKDLVATETGLTVPTIGPLGLTDWSQSQLSRILGIKWSRWFAPGVISPEERAEEINRRLERTPGEWMIRSRQLAPGEPGGEIGVLRAFVAPSYVPIDDDRVFTRLAAVLGSRTDDFKVVRTETTDRSSQYALVTDVEADLGDSRGPDPHRSGFMLTNSETGAGAVALREYVYRLVCTNGLVVPSSGGARLFYRVHRKTTDLSIDRDLAYALAILPERLGRTTTAIGVARRDYVDEPEETISRLLAEDPTLRPHTQAVLNAYVAEPEPTRFGLIQAITLAAQRLPPDDRLALESLAGLLTYRDAGRLLQ